MTKTPQTFKSFPRVWIVEQEVYIVRCTSPFIPGFPLTLLRRHFPEDCVLLVSMELDPCSACFYNGPDARLIICLLWKNTVQYYSDKERVSPDNERTFLWLPHPLYKSQHTSTAGAISMHILVNVQYLQ